jgi:hypothetical protein
MYPHGKPNWYNHLYWLLAGRKEANYTQGGDLVYAYYVGKHLWKLKVFT